MTSLQVCIAKRTRHGTSQEFWISHASYISVKFIQWSTNNHLWTQGLKLSASLIMALIWCLGRQFGHLANQKEETEKGHRWNLFHLGVNSVLFRCWWSFADFKWKIFLPWPLSQHQDWHDLRCPTCLVQLSDMVDVSQLPPCWPWDVIY